MAVPRGCQSRGGTPISLVAIHTAEGATTTDSLTSYLDQPGVEASYHKLVDDHTMVTYLPDNVACWAMLSGNPRSLQLCFTGFAAWSRTEWLTHDTMLRLGAAEVATWCQQHTIPAVKLTPAQVGADQRGICGHWDWTLGKHDGTHTDPGPNFPWDVFLGYVTGNTPRQGDLDMPAGVIPAGALVVTKLVMPIGPSVSQLVAKGWLSLASTENGTAQVWLQGSKGGIGGVNNVTLTKDKRWWIELPDGTDQMTIHTDSPGPVGWCLELQPK